MTDKGEVQRREESEEVAREQPPPPSNVTADPVDSVANESKYKEEVHPNEDMGELHRREKVAEEEQLPLDTAYQIDDIARECNVEYDKEDVHRNEEPKLKSLEPFSGDKLGEGINIVENVATNDGKSVDIFKLETTSVSTTSFTVMEEEQEFTVVETTENSRSIDEQGKISRVVEEREERKSGSSVKVIEFEYDGSQEEIELDLDKFYEHTPHCPNCSHRITKVILRRKPPIVLEPSSIYVKILGYCIKCVTIVHTTVSWHMIRKVVRKMLVDYHDREGTIIDPKDSKTKTEKVEKVDGEDESQVVPSDGESETENSQVIDNGGKEGKSPSDPNSKPTENSQVIDNGGKEGKSPSDPDSKPRENSQVIDNGGKEGKSPSDPDSKPTDPKDLSTKKTEKVEEGNGEDKSQVVTSVGESETGTGEVIYLTIKLLEILKCVVYGGLIESITSLSVVASVAATDATTLNVFAIGLALLFSGLIAFCFNLVDLKNDVNSIKKYNELLGREKNDFLFHSTFAILSYVVFGLIAPTTYALSFRESDNKENKIIVAVVAAFACIFLLAIAKAHVRREKDKHPRYVETTRYYLIIAFIVSGVAYAVGFMIEMLMLRLGLFRSVQRVTCYVPQMISATPTWGSY